MARHASPVDEARERWHDRAGAWSRLAPWIEEVFAPVSERLLAEVERRKPRSALDLACGTGVLAVRIARMLGPLSGVLAVDLAEAMVAETLRRAEGLPNLTARSGDAAEIDLGSDLEVAVCRYGLMLMEDPGLVAARVRAALAPGGIFLVAVWTSPSENPIHAVPPRILAQAARIPPDPLARGPCTLGAPGALEGILRGAGFEEVSVDRVEQAWPAPSLADLVERFVEISATAGQVLAELGPEALPVLERIREELRPFLRTGRDGVALPSASWLARAVRTA